MLKIEDYKIVFAAACLIAVLLLASPTLGLIIHLPGGDKFSELCVLGSGGLADDYPFNVTADESYLINVGVDNHLGSSAYYIVYVKFRNQTEPLPDTTTGTPSPLSPICEYRVFLQDGKSWEAPLTFSFSQVSFSENQSRIGSVTMNGVTYGINETSIWDAENNGYYYELFMELWIYNAESHLFQYHNRYVALWLNMTA